MLGLDYCVTASAVSIDSEYIGVIGYSRKGEHCSITHVTVDYMDVGFDIRRGATMGGKRTRAATLIVNGKLDNDELIRILNGLSIKMVAGVVFKNYSGGMADRIMNAVSYPYMFYSYKSNSCNNTSVLLYPNGSKWIHDVVSYNGSSFDISEGRNDLLEMLQNSDVEVEGNFTYGSAIAFIMFLWESRT